MLVEAACETAAAALGEGGFRVGDLVDGFALEAHGVIVGGWGLALFDRGGGGGVGVGGLEVFGGRARARGLEGLGGGVLFGGHFFDVVGVCARLSVEDGLVVKGDFLVACFFLRGRLLGFFHLLDVGKELDAWECLVLYVPVLVLCFLKLCLDHVEDVTDLGKGFIGAKVRDQETFPARGDIVRIASTILVLFIESNLLCFSQSDGPGVDLAPVFKFIELLMNQTKLGGMPVLMFLCTILLPLVVFSAPEDPKILGQTSCAGFVAAKDMGYDFAVVTRAREASGNCHTFIIDLLRGIIVVVCDLCGIILLVFSTHNGNAIKNRGSTSLSSVANAIVTIGVVIIFNPRVLQLWLFSIDLECTRSSRELLLTEAPSPTIISVLTLSESEASTSSRYAKLTPNTSGYEFTCVTDLSISMGAVHSTNTLCAGFILILSCVSILSPNRH